VAAELTFARTRADAIESLIAQLDEARVLLKRCARKLEYLVRDYPGDKESIGIIETINKLEAP